MTNASRMDTSQRDSPEARDPGSGPILLLIDGHNLAYRAYHAIAPMKAEDGQPTHALFGFVRTLEKLRVNMGATHVCVVFDGGLPPERMALLETYKAQRPPMPDDLRSQFPLIDQYLDAAGIRRIRVASREADDILATLARAAEGEAQRVLIASSDRDLMQVVSPVVWLIEPSARASVTNRDAVMERTGIHPSLILPWRAMIGDSSDNIPGIPGVGPKTATRWLRQYGSMEALWSGLDRLEPARFREVLSRHRAQVERNVDLMRLDTAVPCPFTWRDCTPGTGDPDSMNALLRRVGFFSMLRNATEPRLF